MIIKIEKISCNVDAVTRSERQGRRGDNNKLYKWKYRQSSSIENNSLLNEF
jgi:hypothetical protein